MLPKKLPKIFQFFAKIFQKRHLGRLGASWGRLGRVLGRLGRVLERLGRVLAHLGPSWKRLELSGLSKGSPTRSPPPLSPTHDLILKTGSELENRALIRKTGNSDSENRSSESADRILTRKTGPGSAAEARPGRPGFQDQIPAFLLFFY